MIADARILLDLLIGSSILSLFAIFEVKTLMDISFWLFVLFFVRDLLKFVAEQGYFTTLFSKKFIPSNYGPFRQYLRKLRNAGFSGWLRPLFLFTIVVFYPIYLSFNFGSFWSISSKSIVLFIFLSSALALLQTKSLLTQAFDVRKNLERELMKENEDKATRIEDKTVTWTEKKRKVEQKIISERLKSIGVLPFMEVPKLIGKESWTSRDLDERPVLNGFPWVKDYGSLHLNITIPYLTSDVETREFVFAWTQIILQTIAVSKTEVSQYSLSFFRKDPKCVFRLIRTANPETSGH